MTEHSRHSCAGIIGLVLALALAHTGAAFAQHWAGGAHPGPHMHMDARFAHNHYYYNRGFATRQLPPGHELVTRDGLRYWYGGGNWYRWHGNSWVVGTAPVGVFVPTLPPYYSTIWWSGLPYYYANETYYLWNDSQRGYEVVAPPQSIESQGTTQPPGSNQLFIYPRQGQSEEQQRTDRYECHRWAVTQTGFDPTAAAAGTGVPSDQVSDLRDRYFRAEASCLQGRGYAVE